MEEETREERVILQRLGRRIQSLRQQRGISQEKLATKVGISRIYMGFIEQGRSSPAVGKLYRMARALDEPIREFFRF